MFAALCAQRLLDKHALRPTHLQREYTLKWVPVLEQIWRGLQKAKGLQEIASVRTRLRELYYEGPYQEPDQDNAGEGPDENAAAAAIFAAQAFCEPDGSLGSAVAAANRLIDEVYTQVRDSTRRVDLVGLAELYSRAEIQNEQGLLLTASELLHGGTPDPETIESMRRIVGSAG